MQFITAWKNVSVIVLWQVSVYCVFYKKKLLLMALSLNEYRTKLINKILLANSQEEVIRFIDAAVKALEQNKINGHIISRFIEKTNSDIEGFSPMKKGAQQWSNIQMAKIHFNRISRQQHSTPSKSS
jgi:hypothetical protein